jgi:hypothetical protein
MQALVFQKPAIFEVSVLAGRIVAAIKSKLASRKLKLPAHGVRINLLFKGMPEEMSVAQKVQGCPSPRMNLKVSPACW